MAKKKEPEKKFTDPEEVLELHAYAKEQRAGFIRNAQMVHELVFGEWEPPKPVSGSPKPHKSSKPRAYIDNMRRNILAGVGSDEEIKVLPTKDTESDQKACTKLEWFLSGMDRRIAWESDRDYKRDGGFWYVHRGEVCFETILRYDHKETGKFPIQILATDPLFIFPVRGSGGIDWYTKECEYYVGELKKWAVKNTEIMAALSEMDDTDKVSAVEFRDDKFYACVLPLGKKKGNAFLHNNKPDYGFVPLTEAMCMDTPLASSEYACQSVIMPIMDDLKIQAEMIEKMRTGMEVMFFPRMYYISASGIPVPFNPFAPSLTLEPRAPDSKIEVVNANVNHQIFNAIMQYSQGNINIGAMPESTFGQIPGDRTSGFAIAQTLQQSGQAIIDKLPNLERAYGKNYSNALRLVKKFEKLFDDWAVPVDYDE